MSEHADRVIDRIGALRAEGRSCILCLITATRGSTPQPAGALMAVLDDGTTIGTIGGGWLEAEVTERAAAMLATGTSGVLHFDLDRDDPAERQMACGGSVEVAIAPPPAELPLPDDATPTHLPLVVDTDDGPVQYDLRIPTEERLHVAGAGHIGMAVADLATRLDFAVTVFDDRDAPVAVPPDVTVVTGPVDEALRATPIDASTSCVIATRGLAHDERALEAVIGRGARYVGLLGGRKKRERIIERLTSRGVARAALDEITAPAGVEIGAVTVGEIAVSIAAQLVEARRANTPPAVTGPTPVPAKERA